ncbi:winged helix DNA-binding protein [Actinomycetospora succinea]|uniref:Winged helix DNA-binding protein n=1 Tax=Actinomycetospora succinea TaxID=663603 RepID=A0A4R6VPD5_9PSEU|nr:crosslink repair DNA glycosylase YcaQ family protein [Actinomycetospora succinea]TDQ65893.1 winged helix DNA-binding protein [Actinomycetospora succinea]
MTRADVIAHRLAAQHLDRRLPAAAWRAAVSSGLQDGAPRSAVLSLYARVAGVRPDAWEDPALAQVWGPRGAVWVVPAADADVFTLGLMPHDERLREAAERDADALAVALGAARVRKRDALAAVGGRVDGLLRAATTGRVRIRWDGRDTLVWVVPAPSTTVDAARAELLRRFLAVLGPSDAPGFARWAGLSPADAQATWEAVPVEATVPAGRAPVSGVRLLPPGDLFLQAPDRALLVPDAAHRRAVWPLGVAQPGALLADGEIAGTWRRRGHRVEVSPFGDLAEGTRRAAEEEAAGFPLAPGREVELRWSDR